MKAEKTRKALKIMMLAVDIVPDIEAKKVDEELGKLEMLADTGLCYEDGNVICLGDKVSLITGDVGEVVFECGAYGIAISEGIDYEKIQLKMDESVLCCGNRYNGCHNDNFISLWELYWNFNCEEDVLYPIAQILNND
jgi:hypothetical protein